MRVFPRGGGFPAPKREASEMASHMNSVKRLVAYFSMEIALENAMPSYSGGLGVLAGDTIRAAADLRLPMVAISLLYRKGYFTQRLADDGSQTEEAVEWRMEDFLQEEPARASLPLENRRGELRGWKYDVKGVRGFRSEERRVGKEWRSRWSPYH